MPVRHHFQRFPTISRALVRSGARCTFSFSTAAAACTRRKSVFPLNAEVIAGALMGFSVQTVQPLATGKASTKPINAIGTTYFLSLSFPFSKMLFNPSSIRVRPSYRAKLTRRSCGFTHAKSAKPAHATAANNARPCTVISIARPLRSGPANAPTPQATDRSA